MLIYADKCCGLLVFKINRYFGCAVGCLIFLATAAVSAMAAEAGRAYPDRPLRLIVTYPPGGGTNVVARLVAQKLTDAWGQAVIVDNRAGGGGIVGTDIVAKAAADGYTLLFGTSAGLAIQPLLLGSAPYDPLKAFAPVSLLILDPQLLVVTGTLPANTLKELIAHARANPGKLNYASSGLGAPNYMNMEGLKLTTGIDMLHVPYQGTGPAMIDLLSGRIQLMWSSMPSVLPHLKTGRLKALAVGGTERVHNVPDVPTMKEAGLPAFEPNMPWYGIFVPAGTQKSIIDKLNAQLVRSLNEPETIKFLAANGFEPHLSTPEELGRHLRSEYERLKKLIHAIGIQKRGL